MQSSTRDGLNPKPWLALGLVLLASTAACSVEPLMPGPMGGSSGGASGQGGGNGGTTGVAGTTGTGGGGAVDGGPDCGPAIPIHPRLNGPTVVVCAVDATGRASWTIICPGTGGAGGGGGAGTVGSGGAGGAPCVSTSACAKDEVCTIDDGVCHAPPGCGGGASCPAVCYGNCRPAEQGPACGSTHCAVGMVCCNSSCGICTAPNGGCTQQFCGTTPPAGSGACTTDDECRVEADYCTGCDCRALAANQSLPPCTGPGVRCLADPCMGKKPRCVNGQCAVQ